MNRAAVVSVLGFCAAFYSEGCAPPPSTVPLGLGPLAVAELSAETAAMSARRSAAPRSATPRKSKVLTERVEATPAKAETGADAVETAMGGVDKSEADEEASSAEGAGGTQFDGLYAGDDVAIFRLTGFPDREEKDDKAKIRIEEDSATSVRITLINSADGSDLCELVARVKGNAAVLESAQPCFTSEGDGATQAELTSGRAVVDGDRLTMVAEGTLSVALGDQDVPGELDYSFKGERQ